MTYLRFANKLRSSRAAAGTHDFMFATPRSTMPAATALHCAGTSTRCWLA